MSIRAALRAALRDFYFNSWRLAPANVAWGVLLLAAIVAGPVSLLGAALLVLLAVPAAGIHRMAALIARGQPAAFGDFVDGMHRFGVAALGVAIATFALAIVLTTNIFVGLGADNPIGWFITAMALWGDLGLAMFVVAFWPIFVDPERDGVGLRAKLTLAGLAVIGRPVRVIALTILVAIVLAVSTVLFAVLVVASVAYVALVSSRVVLPMVDALESRLPQARATR